MPLFTQSDMTLLHITEQIFSHTGSETPPSYFVHSVHRINHDNTYVCSWYHCNELIYYFPTIQERIALQCTYWYDLVWPKAKNKVNVRFNPPFTISREPIVRACAIWSKLEGTQTAVRRHWLILCTVWQTCPQWLSE